MTSGTRYRFLEFELDSSTGVLRKAGAAVPLERQPAVVLTALVARGGDLVTRDELRDAVWPAGTHVDFDRGLNYCVREIRAALGDQARAPRFIETRPRVGYRFIAPVSVRPQTGGGRSPWVSRAAVLAAVSLTIALLLAEAGPRNETHHRLAVDVVRSIHDVLF